MAAPTYIDKSPTPAGAVAGLIWDETADEFIVNQNPSWSYAAAASGIANTTTAVTIKTAAGAGVRNIITSLQIMAEALNTATELAIRDGAGGTVLWRTKIPTGGLPTVNIPVHLRSTANTLLEVVTLTASVTGAVYINAQGYTA